jgi:hypothetical protein
VITFLLYIVAFVCFFLAAIGVAIPRVNMVAAGLACWVLTVLIAGWPYR